MNATPERKVEVVALLAVSDGSWVVCDVQGGDWPGDDWADLEDGMQMVTIYEGEDLHFEVKKVGDLPTFTELHVPRAPND